MSNLFEQNHIEDSYCSAFIVETICDDFPIHHHWHYIYELLFVLEGTIIVEYEDRKYTVHKDCMILLLPRHIHGIYTSHDIQAKYIVVKFNSVIFNHQNTKTLNLHHALTLVSSGNPPIFFDESMIQIGRIKELLLEIIEEHEALKMGYELVTEANLKKIFMYIIRYWKGCTTLSPINSVICYEKAKFDEVLKYIDEHYHENITLRDLARMHHMDYTLFSKKFKNVVGYTFKQYLMQVRISKAQDLLLFTDYDLNYISHEVGFSDSSHFIKYYKKIKQVTPNEYRKSMMIQTNEKMLV